jgi:hypothetical protein
VADLATEARFAHLAEVRPEVAASELDDLRTPSGVTSEALRLACGPDGVAVLSRGQWLTQAACIDAARAAWQAAGMAVELACPSELAARRWRALTSLQAGGPGGRYEASARAGPGRRVLVVDAAHHLSPKTLVNLLERAVSSSTKVVLVLGGTVPGNGPSMARSLDQLVDERAGAGLVPTSAPLLTALSHAINGTISLPGIVVQGTLTGTDALSHMAQAWAATARSGRTAPPLMVAFGPAEVEALNQAVRASWLQLCRHGGGPRTPEGVRTGPDRQAGESRLEIPLGERRYATGERVVALRRIGHTASATFGSVVAIGTRSLTVEWQGPDGRWRGEVGTGEARALGYGYATTVPYLRASDKAAVPLLVLGDPLELAARSAKAASAWVTVAGPGRPGFGLGGVAARRRAAISELAVSWPDEEMLALAGPRPLGLVGRRRWTEVVVSCAIRRDLGLASSATRRLDLARLGTGEVSCLESRIGSPRPVDRPVDRSAGHGAEDGPARPGSRRPEESGLTWRQAPSPPAPGL